jgi:hypothetical protein
MLIFKSKKCVSESQFDKLYADEVATAEAEYAASIAESKAECDAGIAESKAEYDAGLSAEVANYEQRKKEISILSSRSDKLFDAHWARRDKLSDAQDKRDDKLFDAHWARRDKLLEAMCLKRDDIFEKYCGDNAEITFYSEDSIEEPIESVLSLIDLAELEGFTSIKSSMIKFIEECKRRKVSDVVMLQIFGPIYNWSIQYNEVDADGYLDENKMAQEFMEDFPSYLEEAIELIRE